MITIIHLFYFALSRVHKNTLQVQKQKYINTSLKTQNVLVSVLKVVRSVQFLMCLGREFQREWAATEKVLWPQVRCSVLCGGLWRFANVF